MRKVQASKANEATSRAIEVAPRANEYASANESASGLSEEG